MRCYFRRDNWLGCETAGSAVMVSVSRGSEGEVNATEAVPLLLRRAGKASEGEGWRDEDMERVKGKLVRVCESAAWIHLHEDTHTHISCLL